MTVSLSKLFSTYHNNQSLSPPNGAANGLEFFNINNPSIMKKFTIAFLMLFAGVSYAQNGPINFEPDGEGADWTWNVFENDANPPLEIIDNPDPSGINTSSTVAQFTALQAGAPFAGVESMHGADLGSFEWNEDNTTITIMVWKSVISDVGIKFDTPTGWSQGELKVANTVTNQWEELTFDFSDFVNPPESEGMLGASSSSLILTWTAAPTITSSISTTSPSAKAEGEALRTSL